MEFSIHKNLHVVSKIVENGDKPIFDRRSLTSFLSSENCCLSPSGHRAWIFSTRGLSAVAQDELVFIFDEQDVTKPEELISDLLLHIQQIHLDATKGKDRWASEEDWRLSLGSFVRHLGLSFTSNVASSTTAAGFLYFSDNSSTHELFPEAPVLFGILVHRDELPTAQCFPIRLLLRLGFEYQSTSSSWTDLNLRLCFRLSVATVQHDPSWNDVQRHSAHHHEFTLCKRKRLRMQFDEDCSSLLGFSFVHIHITDDSWFGSVDW